MKLSTGFVRASGYARKVRRVLFAIAKNRASPQEIIRAAGELNSFIFEKFQEMGVEKGDVVRISVPLRIGEGKIKWDYERLEIEVYRKSEDEKLAKAMEEVEKNEEALEEAIEELSTLAQKLRELSEEIEEKIEHIKAEHTGLKLRFEE